MTELTMVSEHGVYVDGVWRVWLPATRTSSHGWKSAADAVAYWKHPDREHGFVPYLNGREVPWGQNSGGVTVDGVAHVGRIVQRVWFEGEPVDGQLAFDLEEVAS